MGCSSIISVVRLVAAATCVCGCGCGNVLKNSCSHILFSKLTQPCYLSPSPSQADLELSHLHLRYRPRALSSPSHTATSSLISISIFDVDLELSHLHLRRRPRALSSLTQHELSLLLRFGFQAYYWKEVLEERRKINWVLAKTLWLELVWTVDWWAGVKEFACVTCYVSLLILFVGFFLPAVVRPILHSLEASKQVKAPPSYILCVIAGVTGKKQS
ncbi:hypothetical protein Bca4012_051605 [Brassica carinata]